uniref:Uncharacterized protein n=1 Tax=viral metagenome TaxID=1070528 RepID=A0A6C0BLH4_9ZZZZ
MNDFLKQLQPWIQNPYVVGIASLLAVFYGSFKVPQLPQSAVPWLTGPIFKIVFVFIVYLIHRLSPLAAIIVIVIYLLTLELLTHQTENSITSSPYLKPAPAEETQFRTDFVDDYLQRKNLPSPPEVEADPYEGLHPLNKPTEETLYQTQRIENPDDPRQPGITITDDPKINTAIYELNPPFAQHALPLDMDETETKVNTSTVNLPQGDPTRYSACHGYSITK